LLGTKKRKAALEKGGKREPPSQPFQTLNRYVRNNVTNNNDKTLPLPVDFQYTAVAES
jgi:hypothetical protein